MNEAQDRYDPLSELLLVIRDARARGFHLDDNDVRREIGLLVDERQRQAMTLYWLEGKRQAAVGRDMGIAQSSVNRLLAKATRNLAARLAILSQSAQPGENA